MDREEKLKEDSSELLHHWSGVNEFYFVVNDKYEGVNAECEQIFAEIIRNNGLNNAGFETAKDLENRLFSLSDDQILSIVGFLPDPGKMKRLDYSVMNEVILYIMKLELSKTEDSDIIAPNWDDKIQFNGISGLASRYLENGYIQIGKLNLYLENNSDFLADSLKDKVRQMYIHGKATRSGNDLFWFVVNGLAPKAEYSYQTAVIVIMAKYFESCDIFEEPPSDKKR